MPRKRQAKRRRKRLGPSTSVPGVTKAGAVVINDPELAAAIQAHREKRGTKASRSSSSRAGRDFAASSPGEGSDVAGTDGGPTVRVRPGKREA
jgi:hypothetical protein